MRISVPSGDSSKEQVRHQQNGRAEIQPADSRTDIPHRAVPQIPATKGEVLLSTSNLATRQD